MKVISIIYIILLAVALTGCSVSYGQITETTAASTSTVSSLETDPPQQVKSSEIATDCNFDCNSEAISQTTQIRSEIQNEEIKSSTEEVKSLTEFEFLELLEIEPTEETVDLFNEVQFMTIPPDEPETQEPTEETETEPTEVETEETEALTEAEQTYGGLSDADINRIATVVCGEVGSMCGSITLTYFDGSKVSVSGDTIRMMHALVVVNQSRSAKFPSTVSGCIRTYWSSAYDNPYWQSSSKWQHCRQNVIDALNGGVYLPSNVFGATQDPGFGNRYHGYWKYARVDWNTGWTSGVFYYYAYG